MKINLVTEQSNFLQDIRRLLTFIEKKEFIVTIGEAYRTQEQQEIYIKTGKSKTKNSMHLKRLAIDLNFFTSDFKLTYDKEILQKFGNFWESLHTKNRWGGNWQFVDTPHFERFI